VLYPIFSCKLRHFVIEESIERIYENSCAQFVRSQLDILTRLPSGPESLLSSEKSFSPPRFKIKFCVLEAQCWLFNCGLPSPSAVRMTRYYRQIQRTALSGLKPFMFWNILENWSSFIGLYKRGYIASTKGGSEVINPNVTQVIWTAYLFFYHSIFYRWTSLRHAHKHPLYQTTWQRFPTTSKPIW